MSLAPGARLGSFEITELIGSGGMGHVYRARDTRLQRDVAIKVLPDAVATDAERVSRFEREARALAMLNHPNIGSIYGVEELPPAPPDGTVRKALVLELVEGETLADLLARGPLSVEATLEIGRQIADALQAAHDRGLVHRDLKPANIKIGPDGVVKVLDFGLARFGAAESAAASTLTVAVTGPAAVIGTPAYMAPEQAQGKPVDKHADIWALGVVLYEMLAGRRPFRGESVHDTLAAVLTAEPDMTPIPAKLRFLLRACLARDPRRRLHDAGDLAFLIQDDAAPLPRRRRPVAVGLATALALAAVLAFGAWRWKDRRAEPRQTPVRAVTILPQGTSVSRGPGMTSSVTISPDGRSLVIAGSDAEGQRLYWRPIDQLEAAPIAGTERASSPFFSWDGAWIGFFADGRLKRIPAAGGSPVDIVAVPGFPAGASWGPDNRIVFSYGAYSRLYVVDSAGGAAEPLPGVETGRFPEVLADGRTILYEAGGWVHSWDRVAGKTNRLVEGASPRYAEGRLIVTRGTTLLAAPVNSEVSRVTGPLVPLVERVAREASTAGGRHYAVSRNGTLAYIPAAEAYSLVVISPDRAERIIIDKARSIENPQFSPNGERLAVAIVNESGQGSDIWVRELQGNTLTRLTFDGGRAPVWTADGAAVTYSHLGTQPGIYLKAFDGRSEATRLQPIDVFHWLVGWADKPKTLVYGLMEGTRSSIAAVGLDRRILGPASIWGGRLSREGRWLAYYTFDSGKFEVYVTPFPEGGSRWLIGEGTDPVWVPGGKELYYRSGANLMGASLDTTAGIRVLSRRVVFEPFLPPTYDDYDVHRDGRTLALVRPVRTTQSREVVMVIDWANELQQAVPGS